jgi:hypothetical protein
MTGCTKPTAETRPAMGAHDQENPSRFQRDLEVLQVRAMEREWKRMQRSYGHLPEFWEMGKEAEEEEDHRD